MSTADYSLAKLCFLIRLKMKSKFFWTIYIGQIVREKVNHVNQKSFYEI